MTANESPNDVAAPEPGVDAASDTGTAPPPAPASAPAAPLPIGTVMREVQGEDVRQVLGAVSARLLEEGIVGPQFAAALWEREQRYPTGLPTRIPTAIPHSEADHVRTACLAVATFARPVAFGEMGGSAGDTVEAQLMVMPLVTEPAEVVPALQRMMAVLTNEDVVSELLAARDETELRQLAERCLCGADA